MNNPGALQHCSLSSRPGLNESNYVGSALECVWQQPPPSARDSYGTRTKERRWLLPHALQGASHEPMSTCALSEQCRGSSRFRVSNFHFRVSSFVFPFPSSTHLIFFQWQDHQIAK